MGQNPDGKTGPMNHPTNSVNAAPDAIEATCLSTLPSLGHVVVDQRWTRLGSVQDGSRPQWETWFFLAHSQEALVLDIVARADRLTTRYTRHNDPLHKGDVVEVFIGPEIVDGPPSYLELQASPAGILFDAWITNRTDVSVPNPQRELLASFNPEGTDRPQVQVLLDGESPSSFTAQQFQQGVNVNEWRTRFKIPYSAIAHPQGKIFREPQAHGQRRSCKPSSSQTDLRNRSWRVNVFRIQQVPNGREYQSWRPTGLIDFHRPASFGEFSLPAPQSPHATDSPRHRLTV